MKILGLDLGQKNIGVAVSDELYLTAQALTTIPRSTWAEELAAIRRLVDQHRVVEIVIGLPINMDGSKGPSAQWAESFIERLQQALPVKITPWDERLSTVAAERILLEGDVSRKKRRRVIDRLSAAIILQGYLDRHPRTKEPSL